MYQHFKQWNPIKVYIKLNQIAHSRHQFELTATSNQLTKQRINNMHQRQVNNSKKGLKCSGKRNLIMRFLTEGLMK